MKQIKTIADLIEAAEKKQTLITSIEHRRLLAGPCGQPSMVPLTDRSPDPRRWSVECADQFIRYGLHTVETPEDLLV